MKKLIAFALLLSVAAFAGEKKEQHKMDMSHPGHAMINVPTVLCDNCVKTVTTAVKKVDGVESITIDLDKKIAHVNFDPDKVKLIDIEKAIAASGYDANNIKRDEKAHANLPKCCQSKR